MILALKNQTFWKFPKLTMWQWNALHATFGPTHAVIRHQGSVTIPPFFSKCTSHPFSVCAKSSPPSSQRASRLRSLLLSCYNTTQSPHFIFWCRGCRWRTRVNGQTYFGTLRVWDLVHWYSFQKLSDRSLSTEKLSLSVNHRFYSWHHTSAVTFYGTEILLLHQIFFTSHM